MPDDGEDLEELDEVEDQGMGTDWGNLRDDVRRAYEKAGVTKESLERHKKIQERLHCDHDQEWELREEWKTAIVASAEDGEIFARQRVADGPTSQIAFRCMECGMTWRGDPTTPSAPKWVKERYEQYRNAPQEL